MKISLRLLSVFHLQQGLLKVPVSRDAVGFSNAGGQASSSNAVGILCPPCWNRVNWNPSTPANGNYGINGRSFKYLTLKCLFLPGFRELFKSFSWQTFASWNFFTKCNDLVQTKISPITLNWLKSFSAHLSITIRISRTLKSSRILTWLSSLDKFCRIFLQKILVLHINAWDFDDWTCSCLTINERVYFLQRNYKRLKLVSVYF